MISKITNPSRIFASRRADSCIASRNKSNDTLLAEGYLREEFKLSVDVWNITEMPLALSSLIGKFISIQYIHILSAYGKKHWRISADTITQNANQIKN